MIRIGIICPSEIAFRRFLPALVLCDDLSYTGIAIADAREWFGEDYITIPQEHREKILIQENEKAQKFQDAYGGRIFHSYEELISSNEIDAVYIPLPPALHYQWAKKALEYGKHVFVEKPATTGLAFTKELIADAKRKQIALHENYMFVFHRQLEEINDIVKSGLLGDVRLYRIDFGFPRRAGSDFRYCKELGGGALLDCGGYPIKYATELLGNDVSIDCSALNGIEGFSVDMYGSATLSNKKGQTVQLSFGMDNQYKCTLEIWGSKGRLTTDRVLTAPAGFSPAYTIQTGNEKEEKFFSADDAFLKSLRYFVQCVKDEQIRNTSYQKIYKQAELVETFREKAKRHSTD